jgi:hypothetical protein
MMLLMMPSLPLPAIDDVFDFEVELSGEDAAEVKAAVGVEVEPSEGALHRFDRFGRGTERILVRCELGDPIKMELRADTFDGAAGFVGPERFDIWRYERHRLYSTGKPQMAAQI